MKKHWILILAAVLLVIGLITVLTAGNTIEVANVEMHYFSAGQYAMGIFSAGTFSIGVFSIGIFSIGIFSVGIFNIALYALGIFAIAYRKKSAEIKHSIN